MRSGKAEASSAPTEVQSGPLAGDLSSGEAGVSRDAHRGCARLLPGERAVPSARDEGRRPPPAPPVRARDVSRHRRVASDRGGRPRAGSQDRRHRRRARVRSARRRFRSRVRPSPSRAASTTMRARRGGSARLAIARPSSVMRPSPSMAPIAVRSARASFSAARGGGSRKASFDGSATPQSAQSSTRPERSAERISGAA